MGIQKGMILAAGYGTRLLPITKKIPKPIIEVLNIPNLLYNVFLLRNAGIRDIIINLHHLQSEVETYLGDGRQWEVSIEYSKETTLLGTGGGVKKVQSFFGNAPFVVANCDFITNLDLKPLIETHLSRDALATMLLYQNETKQVRYAPVGTTSDGKLCSLPKLEIAPPSQQGIFTGIHLLHPAIFDSLDTEPSGINETLYPRLMKNAPERIYGDFFPKKAFWHDTGDFPALLSTTKVLLKALVDREPLIHSLVTDYLGYEEITSKVYAPKGTKLPDTVSITGPALIGKNCQWGNDVKLGPNVVLGNEVKIGSQTRLTQAFALSRSCIEAKTAQENKAFFENEIVSID